MKRQLIKGKIFLKYGMHFGSQYSAMDMDSVVIGYKDEGEARLPASLFSELALMNQWEAKKLLENPVKLLYLAVKHSQYVNFEPVR